MAKFMLVTDLDDTLVGDDEALKILNEHLNGHREEHGTKIVYATGRSPLLYQHLKDSKQLLDPDALIAAVGTEIYYDSDSPDPAWTEMLSPDWNRDTIVATCAHFSDLVPQQETEQRPFKISYFLTEPVSVEVLPQIESLFKQRGLMVKLVYSGGKDLDILPRNADKGLAMQFLAKRWEIEPTRTVVCGDSGNDIALFSAGEERGIIVGNAQSELLRWHRQHPSEYRYLALAPRAGGILEGLKYFGFL